MKVVRRRNTRTKALKIALSLSVVLITSSAVKAQYAPMKSLTNDDLSQSKKLELFVKSPGEVLEKFGSKQYYMPSLGQFCLWEEKFTKAAKRPIKIRLGDQDYVDKLENKRN